jgi:urea transport system ATP-binding protein
MKNPIKEIILAVEGLTVSFNGFKAVDDFSMYIDEGRFTLLLAQMARVRQQCLISFAGKQS